MTIGRDKSGNEMKGGMERGMDGKAVKGVMFVLVLMGALGSVFDVGLVGTDNPFVDGNVTPTALEYYFTLHAVVTNDPYWGRFGGYHDILLAVQNDLAEISINLVIEVYDPYTWWERVWGDGWNKTWEEGGWDLSISEWWMMPTGLIPLESLMYSWMTPPTGKNIMPWLNEVADKLLWRGMHTLNAIKRKEDLWKWQQVCMHDPPMVNLYYPKLFEVTAVWIEGWDPVVRFHDVSHLFVNVTRFGLYAPPDRKAIGDDTLIYGIVEPVWCFNPLFAATTEQEKLNSLTHDTLYALSRNPWPNGPFVMKPDLAAIPPIWLTGPNGPNTRVRVPLRANVTWSDGFPFNATDVKFTFDLILNPDTKAVAYGDFEPVVQSVQIVNATCVDFILYEPYADITTLLGIPGATIVPWHILKAIPPVIIFKDHSNWDWTRYLPGTGPFNMTEYVLGDHITLKKNLRYFGYNASIVNPANASYGPYGEPYWGPYNITTLILEWMPDPAVRLMAMQNLQIDFCQPIPAPIPIIPCMHTWPTHKVWEYDRPSSNLLFFNLNNPYLSNRYVRQAIAHAINYTNILTVILPTWGVVGVPGKTPITPLHNYNDPSTGVTVQLFNPDLPSYAYNLTRALKYMDMWYYSQEDKDYTKGPVGDADFSGLVELRDFYIWVKNFGTNSTDWVFLPGNDIDPDFDNNGLVEMPDFYRWTQRWGFFYPENSTTHEWSR